MSITKIGYIDSNHKCLSRSIFLLLSHAAQIRSMLLLLSYCLYFPLFTIRRALPYNHRCHLFGAQPKAVRQTTALNNTVINK